jgi:hypothetical protein
MKREIEDPSAHAVWWKFLGLCINISGSLLAVDTEAICVSVAVNKKGN